MPARGRVRAEFLERKSEEQSTLFKLFPSCGRSPGSVVALVGVRLHEGELLVEVCSTGPHRGFRDASVLECLRQCQPVDVLVGDTHEIPQGEGGEQGDPLMPMLFAVGQHRALEAVQSRLRDSEKLFAFLDDMYVVCTPDSGNLGSEAATSCTHRH